jgi:hypothetical protein
MANVIQSRKTEILFFSNTGNRDNIEFSLNGKSIPLSTSHKHLGVILSQNAKWNEHLENMITNITKHLGILRKLKFSLNRSNLFFAPVLNTLVKSGIIVELAIQTNYKIR